jgi:hypothetical protein
MLIKGSPVNAELSEPTANSLDASLWRGGSAI